MGNRVAMDATGKGSITVEIKKGTHFIKQIFLIPSLKENLLKIGQMMQNGYALDFKEDVISQGYSGN